MSIVISKRILSSVIVGVSGLGVSQISIAANDLEIVTGNAFTNLTGTTSLSTTNDSAILGIDYFSSVLNIQGATLDISTATNGASTQGGNITFTSAFDMTPYSPSTLTLNAHNDIVFNGDVFASTLSSMVLNLNPDSDASGAGQVIINGGFDVFSIGHLNANNSALNDFNINGDLLVNGTVARMAFSSAISGDLNISNTGTFDSRGNLTVQTINVATGGSFNYVSGNLHITNGDATIATDGLLGPSLNISGGGSVHVVNQTVGTAAAASGVVNVAASIDGNIVDNTLTVNQGGSYNLVGGSLTAGNVVNSGQILVDAASSNLQSAGNIVNDGQLTLANGRIQVADIVNNGQFDFTGGRLHLTNAGVTVANGGLLGQDVLLIGTGKQSVQVVSQVVGTADINSGSVTVEEGAGNTVDTTLTINAGGSYNLAGGNLSVGEIINNGSFSFTDGRLSLTNSGLQVVSGGLLGSNLVIDRVRPTNPDGTPVLDAIGNAEIIERNISAVSLSVGDATPGSGSVLQQSSSMGVTNALTINSGGSYQLDGGSLTVGSIANNGGSFQWTNGSLIVTNSAFNIGQNGPLGTVDLVLSNSGNSIYVKNNNVLTIDAGSSLTINSGSTVSAGSIVNQGALVFNSGTVNLTNSDLLIGSGGILGQNLELTSGKRLTFVDDNGLVNNHGIVIASDGTLTLNGGTLSADNVVSSGTFEFLSGLLRSGGDLRLGTGSFLGTSLALNTNSRLSIENDSVLTIDAGSTLTMDGGYLNLSEGLVANGDFVFNSGEVFISRVGVISTTENTPELVIGSSPGAMNDLNLGLAADLRVDGEIVVEAGSTLVIGGGSVRANAIDNAGAVSLLSGGLTLRDLDIGTADVGTVDEALGALGANVVLGANTTLTVQNFNTRADANLVLNGGVLDVGSWRTKDGALTFNAGHIRMSSENLYLGGASASTAFGDNVALSTDRTLDVGGRLVVAAGGRVTSTGGAQKFGQVVNDGTIAVSGGEITISKGWSSNGSFVNNSVVNIDAGTLRVNEIVATTNGVTSPVPAATEYLQTAGRTRVNGTLIANDVVIQGGTLMGVGVVDGNVLVEGGQINPGNSPGALEITGDLVLTDAGTLHFEVGSDGLNPAGYLWDQLIVGGNYDLQGGLVKFSLLDSVSILDFEADFTIDDFFRNGTAGLDTGFDLLQLSMFNNLDLYAYDVLGDGWYALTLDAAGGFTAIASTSPVPVPAAAWLFGSGLIGLIGVARRRKAA